MSEQAFDMAKILNPNTSVAILKAHFAMAVGISAIFPNVQVILAAHQIKEELLKRGVPVKEIAGALDPLMTKRQKPAPKVSWVRRVRNWVCTKLCGCAE